MKIVVHPVNGTAFSVHSDEGDADYVAEEFDAALRENSALVFGEHPHTRILNPWYIERIDVEEND